MLRRASRTHYYENLAGTALSARRSLPPKSPISRGFHRRHEEAEPAGRVPPGQYVTSDFPVLSAGPTPHTALANWTFSIEGGASPVSWTWT